MTAQRVITRVRDLHLQPWMAVLLALSASLAGAAHLAADRGWIIGNASASVPRGLYIRADPGEARYVTFCLGDRALPLPVCSNNAPDAARVLKRIAARQPDGSLIVTGDTPTALDSRLIGPVAPPPIRGWWRALLSIDREGGPDAQDP